MFRRFGIRVTRLTHDKYFSSSPIYHKQRRDESETPSCLPGGGLEKFQGCMKEECYFTSQNLELMEKLRKEGSTLKCEHHFGNWSEFYKTIECSDDNAALRESCCMNKHKNCQEEVFFLNESNDNVKMLQTKNLELVAVNEKH